MLPLYGSKTGLRLSHTKDFSGDVLGLEQVTEGRMFGIALEKSPIMEFIEQYEAASEKNL